MNESNFNKSYDDSTTSNTTFLNCEEAKIDLYNRNVEKSAMYEALAGISPQPPKEKA